MGESSINLTTISRRNVLRAAVVGAGAFAIAGPAVVRPERSEAATTFYKGADISWAPQMEAQGYYYAMGAWNSSTREPTSALGGFR